jgi:hypothetical protein
MALPVQNPYHPQLRHETTRHVPIRQRRSNAPPLGEPAGLDRAPPFFLPDAQTAERRNLPEPFFELAAMRAAPKSFGRYRVVSMLGQGGLGAVLPRRR